VDRADGGNVLGTDFSVKVMATRCPTCVFHAGNRMSLHPGRLADMLKNVHAIQGHITCHDTLDYSGSPLPPSVC
jgi:hypothetical protein